MGRDDMRIRRSGRGGDRIHSLMNCVSPALSLICDLQVQNPTEQAPTPPWVHKFSINFRELIPVRLIRFAHPGACRWLRAAKVAMSIFEGLMRNQTSSLMS